VRIRNWVGVILVSGGLTLSAMAQAPAASAAPAEGKAKAKAERPHKGPKAGASDAQTQAAANQQVEKLTKELNLTPEQQDKVRRLIVENQRAVQTHMRMRVTENRERLDDLRKQMAEAKAAKDTEKLKSLEAQMQELLGKSQEAALREKLMKDIEENLSLEQKAKFQQIKGDLFSTEHKLNLENNPMLLMKAIDSLNLPNERRQKIQAIADEFKGKPRKGDGHRGAAKADGSRGAAKAEASEICKKMMDQLTPEEQAKVKAWRPESKSDRHSEGKEGKSAKQSKGNGKHKRGQDAPAAAQ
jgi:hypothetical protein